MLILGLGVSLTLTAVALTNRADVVTQTINFKSGDETISAYLARPKGDGPFPALIVIHEWWGLNDWIKQNAREFADRGYVALAVDLYRGKVAQEAEMAHELSRGLPSDRAVRDMKAALDDLHHQPYVNKKKIGSIGWCMGGGYSLQLALNADLTACVICYGSVITEANQIKKIKAPILGIFGANDRGIAPDSVRAFEKALSAHGIPNEIHIYEGVGHAFMNPNNRSGYNAETAKKAWQEIDTFFDQKLKH
jgi:carboxymethylenebutenolidase